MARFRGAEQFATNAASNDWAFSLDADERVSAELRSTIQQLKNNHESPRADGYRVARRTFYMNRWVRGGGWYPDYQLRLFNRNRGSWGDRLIHESFQMHPGARIETLCGDLLHYTVRDTAHHEQMIRQRYAPLGAQQMYREGKRSSAISEAFAGPSAFVRSYILKGGFRDGAAGLTIAKFAAQHATLKHKLLRQLHNSRDEK